MTFSSVNDPTHLYFITASIVQWKHLFIRPKYAKIVLNSLAWLQQQKRIWLFGSFTAHELLNQLRADHQEELLKILSENRRGPRHKHSIWQDIQAKNIYSMDILQQKLEYIHQNPVSKDWRLVEDRADYLYSSAAYYDYGRQPLIAITDVNEWLTTTPSPSPAQGA